ncbi:hypothetical protein [Mesobacillus foraminis]|uniref:Uncharacterized protein n=1 Tax=Mesobacillus foraminis TaxID=279826 RepID=A0A4R2BAU2_9BACI|nr:hypothetical protein [Mesobacillus foraminis]TCN22664.1 hypothetical protein EV146_110150 [Mesobacillus foraminis]
MYIWNLTALILALREDSLNEKQKKTYRNVFWILAALTILTLPVVVDPSSMNTYDMMDLACFIVINAIGIMMAYGIYKKGVHEDFFLPYFSLNIPIFIRTTILSILLMIIGYTYILMFAPQHSMDGTNVIDLAISIIVELVFNAMLVQSFRKVYQ